MRSQRGLSGVQFPCTGREDIYLFGFEEYAGGMIYRSVIGNGADPAFWTYPTDGDGWFTMADTLDLHLV